MRVAFVLEASPAGFLLTLQPSISGLSLVYSLVVAIRHTFGIIKRCSALSLKVRLPSYGNKPSLPALGSRGSVVGASRFFQILFLGLFLSGYAVLASVVLSLALWDLVKYRFFRQGATDKRVIA
jgi:hypothetical protein